jgi:transcriptional regulator with XRE-family HTH domain
VPSRAGSPSFRKKIGARIRVLREEAGLTQEAVAWASGIPKAHLSRIESGENLPSLPILSALAKHIGAEPYDILAFDLKKPRAELLDAAREGDAERVRAAIKRLGLNARKNPRSSS